MCLKWLIAVCLLLIMFPSGSSGDPSPPYWWAIELRVSIQGDYRMIKENQPLSGRYRYRFLWRGSMERDNGDYILYQGDSELLFLEWHEAVQNQSRDLGRLIRPEIFVNYVVRKDSKIHVDFNIRPSAPGSEKASGRMAIHFPQSAEHEIIDPSNRYNRWVGEGSNTVALIERQIYDRIDTEGEFGWEWRLKRPAGEHHHSVRVELKLFRKLKKPVKSPSPAF
jgi:hypothetical protein